MNTDVLTWLKTLEVPSQNLRKIVVSFCEKWCAQDHDIADLVNIPASKEEFIQDLEWIFARITQRIEQQLPRQYRRNSDVALCISWANGDGYVVWEGEFQKEEPLSLNKLSLDAASLVGGLVAESSQRFVEVFVENLRKGNIALPRLEKFEESPLSSRYHLCTRELSRRV